jgi:mannosylfructose-phosphate synthase
MLSTHGVHQWKIVPGLPDTGGQNVFVNQLSGALIQAGFRVTIVNRGGYQHPISGQWQRGVTYKDERQRILYLDDGLEEFVRKEEMGAQIPFMIDRLVEELRQEQIPTDLILSHYWDAAVVAEGYRSRDPDPPPHYWIPHSLGRMKQRNVPSGQWDDLRIPERIDFETRVLHGADGVIATSNAIQLSLRDEYGYGGEILFLPPCIDTNRFRPHHVPPEGALWDLLGDLSPLPAREIRGRKIITEISRTDRTKRKEVLIQAFARIQQKHPDTLLVISIDEHKPELAQELIALIDRLEIRPSVAIVGPIYDVLPDLYAGTYLYCTPSVMEGFGMAAQEAAATGIPVVASTTVPFAREYLLGENPRSMPIENAGSGTVAIGEAAILVDEGGPEDFAEAIDLLLSDHALRQRMGDAAYQLTIPYFTWSNRVPDVLESIGLSP